MAGSVHDQAHLAGLFDAGETARLFSAAAEVRALLIVEGALASVQGAAGLIPEVSGRAIHRASLELQIDPAGLSAATARAGVCVPALIAAFRAQMQAPEHAQYIHWGATSQDILDTALMLRLRQARQIMDADLGAVLGALAGLAETHAATPMLARTYGQHAAPTSFGAVVASWGWPLLAARTALAGCTFPVSLSGAVGTSSALGPDPAALRARLAEALGLSVPTHDWHVDRGAVLGFAAALEAAAAALEKMAEDVAGLAQSDVGEVVPAGGGGSSTMPHKQNPVAPAALIACARMVRGLGGVLRGAGVHRHQRDGAAWFTEWMALPQIVLGTAAAARHGAAMAGGLAPVPGRMARALGGDGLAFTEALSFALAARMPRPEAAEIAGALAAETRATGTPLPELARARYPDLPAGLFDPAAQLGTAPGDARAFARAVRDTAR